MASSATVIEPSTSAYINLSNYMYFAYNTTYGTTTLQADIGFVPLTAKNGSPITSIIDKDGFYSEAFASVDSAGQITKNSQVVVAYEGTNLLGQSNAFTGGQLVDDAAIGAGNPAPSYRDSVLFARKSLRFARSLGIKRSEVFVTGHSLGAANAEYASRITGLGGVTFAAPGINRGGVSSSLTDYVDAADPIGNYAGDNAFGSAVRLSSDVGPLWYCSNSK